MIKKQNDVEIIVKPWFQSWSWANVCYNIVSRV